MFPLVSSCLNAAHYDIGSDGDGMRFCPLASLDTPTSISALGSVNGK